MPLDASIIQGIKPFQVQPQSNMLMQLMQLQGAQRQNELGALQADETRQGLAEKAGLRSYLQANPNLDSPEGQSGLYRAAPTQAGGILKSRADIASAQSTTAKNNAEAAKINAERAHTAIVQTLQTMPTQYDPQALGEWYKQALSNGVPGVTMQTAQAELQKIPQDQAGYAQWRQQQLMRGVDAAKQIEMAMPKYVDLGSAQVNTNPLSSAAPLINTVSPNTVANNRQSAADVATTQAGENLRAGVLPGGGLSPDMETTAKAIAKGQLPAPTGMALLNPKNQRVLARVMEINPEYDSTTVDAKKKAAKDFTTGSQGNAMRSFAVAGQHLDQLGQLVDALNNGNLQIANKIGNMYAEQTGSAAPTNFDAAKDVVSKEVVKAIVAGGGGVSERQELSDLMSKAKSPAQLKGVIQQYRNLMAAQHEALLQQRDAAGLPRSSLPGYGPSADGSSSLPPDVAAALAKHGAK
jgi:hypothetical protein